MDFINKKVLTTPTLNNIGWISKLYTKSDYQHQVFAKLLLDDEIIQIIVYERSKKFENDYQKHQTDVKNKISTKREQHIRKIKETLKSRGFGIHRSWTSRITRERNKLEDNDKICNVNIDELNAMNNRKEQKRYIRKQVSFSGTSFR